MSLIKVYQSLLLVVVYVSVEGLTKSIIVRDICFRWQMEKGMFMIRLTGIIELAVSMSKFQHEHITMWLFYFRVE
jgi:hypothetical protein